MMRRVPFAWLLPVSLLVSLLACLAVCPVSGALAQEKPESPEVHDESPFIIRYVEITGSISPAQTDFLQSAMDAASNEGAGLLIIRLDTPGGSGEAMRDMVRLILNAPVPVAVWVGPAGAHAASAGVFIVAAADVAAMAPQTTIGAASPVGPGGEDIKGTMETKVKNDIMSFIRGVAEARGRNVQWYEEAVDKAVSITAKEAVLKHVVDLIADSPDDLIQQLGKRGIPYHGESIRFDPDTVVIHQQEPGFRHAFLAWLLDPQVAYFLLLGGMAGLFFELATPGAILPGVLGGLSMLLALYAMSILPTNAAGLIIILFGLVLFLLELHVTSYGLLSVAGVVSLFVGSVILFKSGQGAEGVDMLTIIVTVSGVSLLLLLAVWLAAKAHRARPSGGSEGMLGTRGVVQRWSGGRGTILAHGELWNAVSEEAGEYAAGDVVRVLRVDGLTLEVMLEEPSDTIHPAHPSHPAHSTTTKGDS
ncbi:protein of unknown function DUF107 [Desulfovibrio sp. X2]|uniref:NfeD family protein n=1 Tax=Desulfovibrio sp. X2 TaxID=941449 RepID=UPI000358AC94|nr:nodulation protein NfeD [Desulfovibrio sp. X2]EPR44013.1 protein of unknown function DUF107 [Desulfovibrio sp. X2]